MRASRGAFTQATLDDLPETWFWEYVSTYYKIEADQSEMIRTILSSFS